MRRRELLAWDRERLLETAGRAQTTSREAQRARLSMSGAAGFWVAIPPSFVRTQVARS